MEDCEIVMKVGKQSSPSSDSSFLPQLKSIDVRNGGAFPVCAIDLVNHRQFEKITHC